MIVLNHKKHRLRLKNALGALLKTEGVRMSMRIRLYAFMFMFVVLMISAVAASLHA